MNLEMKEEGGEARNSLQSEGGRCLQQALELVNALVSTSYSARCFPVKWQLIREKLEQLEAALTAAAGCSVSSSDSGLSELLRAVASTAEDGRTLIRRCSGDSYTGGKLQLKSDLDIMASKLELHIKRLAEVYASGVLTHSQSMIVSRPGIGACREDMRFYVNDLLARLKIRDEEMRTRALAELNEILHEDERYAKILATETSNGASLLVSFLEAVDERAQEEAAKAVSLIAEFDSYRGVLVMAGAISLLIHVLEAGSQLAKERAAQALKKLTENSDNAWSVSAHGGVSTLLKICSDHRSGEEVIRSSCSVLKSLSSVEEIRKFMLEEGAVSIIVKLSRSPEESSQIQAIELLTVLSCEDEAIKQSVLREGVVGSLVQVLDPSTPHSSKAREVALRAIENFCFSSHSSMNFLMNSGFLERVLFFLRNGEISIQESALKAVSRLCALSEMTKKAMGDAGFMPELMKLLEAKSFQVREMAAEALCGMVSVQRNRKRFVQEEHNVQVILQLLNPEEERSSTKRFLLSVLTSLADSNSVRRKIASSGYVKYLEKLAETDVTDAKKIVKKLSGNRLRSILTGIWNS